MTNLSVKLQQLLRSYLQSLSTLAALRGYRTRILQAGLAELDDIKRIARKNPGGGAKVVTASSPPRTEE